MPHPTDSERRKKRDASLRSLDEAIGEHLAESWRSGELQSAESFGRPLAEPEGWAQTPTEFRLPFKILKNAGAPPPEVELFRKRAALRAELQAATAQADAALDDDLNTPVALAALGEMMRVGNETVMLAQKRKKDPTYVASAAALGRQVSFAIVALCKQLGLLNVSPAVYAARVKARRLALRQLSAESIEQKLKERVEARKAKDFARGDAIREELLALGVAISDTADGGSSWTITQ